MDRSVTNVVESSQAERKAGIRWHVLFIVGVMLAIAACEYIFAYRNVAHGIILALALAMLIYVAISLLRFDNQIVKLATSLALIPLYILFTSSLPWFFISQQYLLPAVYACIMGLCFWYVHQENIDFKTIFGFRKDKLLINVLIGISAGVVMGIGEFLVLRPSPVFPTFEVKYLFRDIVYMLAFVGLAEEFLFRGLIQNNLMGAFGWKWGLFGASALFAVMHLTWRSMPELAFVFFAGVLLGFMYLKTRDLTMPIIAHGFNNVMLVAIAPYIFPF